MNRRYSTLRFLEASERWLEAAEEEHGVHERLRRGVRILQKRESSPIGTEWPLHLFLVPGVKTRPVFDVSDFSWIDNLRAGSCEINKELEQNDALWTREATPYADNNIIHRRKFNKTRDSWFRLPIAKYRNDFERAWPILEGCPLLDAKNPQACLFSIMTPGAHIPPHTGLVNSRLVCHLPLPAPEGCQLRVADQLIDVEESEPYVFDDCFEHEAWNRSGRKRVVMIFLVPHPGIEGEERKALARFLKGYRAYRRSLRQREQEFILDHFEIDYGTG